jgi:hypothetical protein
MGKPVGVRVSPSAQGGIKMKKFKTMWEKYTERIKKELKKNPPSCCVIKENDNDNKKSNEDT